MNLQQVREIALSLPEVNEEPHFQFTSFRVKGKIIATSPPGEEFLHVFIPDSERDQAIALNPQCVEKLLWGSKVAGVKVTLSAAKSTLIKQLLLQAWANKAPTTLVAQYRKA